MDMDFKVGQTWRTRDVDGWVVWNGGECPVPDDTVVEVRFFNGKGQEGEPRPANRWAWSQGHRAGYEISAYRVVESVPAAEPDSWIEWKGGECPVPVEAEVEYVLRNGDSRQAPADSLVWTVDDDPYDIVKYRVLAAPAPAAEPEPEPFSVTEPGEYVTRSGRKAVVTAVGLRGTYPVHGYVVQEYSDTSEQWTNDGRFLNNLDESIHDLVGRWNPYTGVAIDTPVWVRDSGGDGWLPRHFAGVSEGMPLVWADGVTSHTTGGKGSKTAWDEVSLTKPE